MKVAPPPGLTLAPAASIDPVSPAPIAQSPVPSSDMSTTEVSPVRSCRRQLL